MHPDIYKRPLLFLLITLILGILFFYKPVPANLDVSYFIPQKEVVVTGRVERFYAAKPNSNNVIVKVQTVNGQKANGYVYARLPNFEPLYKDVLEIQGRLQQPYGIDLLGSFNWRKYLAYKHVFSEIKGKEVRVIKHAAWPWRILRAVRSDILRTFEENFKSPLAQVAGGILLGERGDLPSQTVTAFQDSGAIHLLVASGGNVGFVTLMTLAFGGLFGLKRKKALWLALGIAGIYTLIAGADAPLLRAYFMTLSGCVGYYLGRNSGVWQGLVLSCVVILVGNPAALFETGFVMSFLATAGLILGLANYPVPSRWPKVARFFMQIFIVTLCVQLALLPVFTNVFHKVSLTGLVANMVLVPLASVLLALSFAYYVFSVLHIGILLYYPTVFSLKIFVGLVRFFASFELSSLPVAAWGTGTILAYYAGFFWLLHAPLKTFARKIFLPVLCIIVSCLIWQGWENKRTHIYLLDEWYKNAVLIQTGDGNLFIVGPQIAPEKIEDAVYKLGRLKADAVFLTDTPKKFDYSVCAKQVIYPFGENWPEKTTWKFHKTFVKLIWGLHQTSDGRVWENTGYSGSERDDVSYCFTVNKGPGFCVGAKARFVQMGERTEEPVVNETVRVTL